MSIPTPSSPRAPRCAPRSATRLGAALRESYRPLAGRGPYSPDAASAGRRALQNVGLDLLAAAGAPRRSRSRRAQFQQADNMTDRHGGAGDAVPMPCRHGRPRSTTSTGATRDDPLVLDKWLALQAAFPEPATLDRVRALMAHPAFSLANPNRVRALIGAFAQANQTQFNRPDGAGFDFVADIALDLDPKNPQVAARLLDRIPLLARARTGAPRARRGGAAAHRCGAESLARPRRHCRAARSTPHSGSRLRALRGGTLKRRNWRFCDSTRSAWKNIFLVS